MKSFKEVRMNESDESIEIEVLDSANQWRRNTGGIFNRSQDIARALDYVKRSYPNARVRAIGSVSKKLYDMRS